MDQTSAWMLGVIAFGIVFYIFAMYYANHCGVEDES